MGRLVQAIVNINVDYLCRSATLDSIKRVVNEDPLLERSLLGQRLDVSCEAPSLDLGLRICNSNFFILGRIQDDSFKRAKKPDRCSRERIEINFSRFKAAQMAIENKTDRGDGDTLFTQLFKGMETKEPNQWRDWWRREGDDDRVFRANFKDEHSIDAGGPYRELMENISRELTSSVLPVLAPTEN